MSPGAAPVRGRPAGRSRPASTGKFALHHPASRAGCRADPLGRLRGGHHGNADRTRHRERRPAVARLQRRKGPDTTGARGLHLPQEIRSAGLSRRRPRLGPRDGDARGCRGHRQEVPARTTRHAGARPPRRHRPHRDPYARLGDCGHEPVFLRGPRGHRRHRRPHRRLARSPATRSVHASMSSRRTSRWDSENRYSASSTRSLPGHSWASTR